MKKIFAKFKSTCAETGKAIERGDQMYYDYGTRKCYSLQSTVAQAAEKANNDRQEARNVSAYVNAQEEAYCDNRYHG